MKHSLLSTTTNLINYDFILFAIQHSPAMCVVWSSDLVLSQGAELMRLNNVTWVLGDKPTKAQKKAAGCWSEAHKVTSYDLQKGRRYKNKGAKQ